MEGKVYFWTILPPSPLRASMFSYNKSWSFFMTHLFSLQFLRIGNHHSSYKVVEKKSTLACTLWWFCFVFFFSSFILSPPEEKRNCCLGKFWFLQYVVRENRVSDHASTEDEEPGLEATLGVCVNAQEDREYLLQLLISSFCYDT